MFLGWDAPALQRVRDYLIPDASDGPVDLRATMVIVPTRHAGRRLREALAIVCSERHTYLLPPRIVTPPSLIASPETDTARQALDVAAVWTRLLLDIDSADYQGLFPHSATRTFAWAFSTARLLQSLRSELLEHGLTIRGVLESHGNLLEERERWEDMARLEDLYVSRYREVTGESEPGEVAMAAARSLTVPDGTDRIIVACVTDPAPLALRALAQLAGTVSTTVLVHAPEAYAGHFDDWGRPDTDRWHSELMPIQDTDGAVHLAGSPATESRRVLVHIRDHSPNVAVGIIDPEVAPYLEADLQIAGLAAFDPNGKAVSMTPLLQLLHAYRDMLADGSYRSLATLLRNADMLDFLSASAGVRADALLRELDTYQNHYLPASAAEMLTRFHSGTFTDEVPAGRLDTLRTALNVLAKLSLGASRESVQTRLRHFLQSVFTYKVLQTGSPDDDAFRATAELVDEALEVSTSASLDRLGFTDTEVLDMLLEHLAGARFVPQRPRNAIDLEGWLELQWNEAAHVIVAGMNEGKAPARLGNETFLPESLRKALGLRTNDDRYGRDVYLMRSLFESRCDTGSVVLLAAKTTARGDPLLPSRILFRCTDEELPGRAAKLFGPPADSRSSVPSTVSFRLSADAPLGDAPSAPSAVSVTALRDYLACPFRFYLKHVLRLESMDDRKRELDGLDFGSLVHQVLNTMAADAAMRDCADARVLNDYFTKRLDEWGALRLGASLPLNIAIQLDAAKERLAAAARVHAQAVAAGWRMVSHEQSCECSLGSLTVKGRIDRIDRHVETGQIRVLDYKTSEDAKTPEDAHLATWRDTARSYARFEGDKKPRRWTDLQLPLYVLMAAEQFDSPSLIIPGYFSLPNNPDGAAIVTWDGFSDQLLQSARACAQGAAGDILRGRFWPPSEKVPFDDFEVLFPGGADATTIDPGRLAIDDGEERPCR